MNQRNDDDHRQGYRSGQQYSQPGGQRESQRQGRARQDYAEQSDRSRMQQQAGGTRGEYYGGEQFGERAQGMGWNEDRGNWEYEGGPERYSASGYGEQGSLQGQSGRYRGAQSQFGGQREYGSQNIGGSDYYSGRQGYRAQESFGGDYNTYGRSQGQGYGEGSGYTRSQSQGVQQGRSFAQQRGYSGGGLYGGESSGAGGRASFYGSGQDYLDDGEMSGYRSSGSSRYGTAPGQYGYGGYGAHAGSFRGVGPKNYTRSDERLTEEINERLTDDDDLDATDLTVRVSNGKVTLEGNVDQRWMKHRAEDIADGCIGVKEVDNRIQVTSTSSMLGQRATDTRATSTSRAPQTGATTGSGTTGGTTPH